MSKILNPTYLERLEDRLTETAGYHAYVDVTYTAVVIEIPVLHLDELLKNMGRILPPCIFGQPTAQQYADMDCTVRLRWTWPQAHERRERLREAIRAHLTQEAQ